MNQKLMKKQTEKRRILYVCNTLDLYVFVCVCMCVRDLYFTGGLNSCNRQYQYEAKLMTKN